MNFTSNPLENCLIDSITLLSANTNTTSIVAAIKLENASKESFSGAKTVVVKWSRFNKSETDANEALQNVQGIIKCYGYLHGTFTLESLFPEVASQDLYDSLKKSVTTTLSNSSIKNLISRTNGLMIKGSRKREFRETVLFFEKVNGSIIDHEHIKTCNVEDVFRNIKPSLSIMSEKGWRHGDLHCRNIFFKIDLIKNRGLKRKRIDIADEKENERVTYLIGDFGMASKIDDVSTYTDEFLRFSKEIKTKCMNSKKRNPSKKRKIDFIPI